MALGIVFEIAIILVLALASIKGYKMGLFLLLTNPLRIFISFGIAVLVYREIIDHTDYIGFKVIGFIITLVLSRVLLGILIIFLSKLFNLGLIGKINRLLGVVVSFFVACLWIWILTSLAYHVMSKNGMMDNNSFKVGRLFSFFLETSPFDLLEKILVNNQGCRLDGGMEYR